MRSFLLFILTLFISLSSISLYAQVPANDNCSGAISMPPFPRDQSCPADDGVMFTSTLTGQTNVNATPQAPYPLLNCSDGTTTEAAADVFYTFQASGAINEITVNTSGMNGVQIIGYVGPDCNNLTIRDCAVGAGTATLRVIAQPGSIVFFSVAGEPNDVNDQGTFDITVESSSDCDACAREDNGEVTFNPRNASGTYACGSTVEVCFTLFEYEGNDAGSVEWLHSIVPTFGSGWDVTSISPTSAPPACNGNGSWNWYPAGWTSCQTGDSYPFGFAFESAAGYNAACGTSGSSPGNNWGDGGNGCTSLPAPTTWCFNIDVLACPPGSGTFTGDDLTVSIQVFSDGFSGSWTQQACAAPTFSTTGSVIVCVDEDPIATPTAESCPGFDDGSLQLEGNGGLDPGTLYNFVVRDASSNAVYICNACPSPVNTGNLPAGDYTIEATGIISGCPQNTMVTIDPGTAPDATADFVMTCPDSGPIQLLGSTTTPGSTITYSWTGPNGFTATGDSPFTNDPADPGIYTLTVTVDGCPSDPVDVDVAYIDFFPMGEVDNDTPCFGEDITLTVTGLGAGATYIWFDSNGNLIPGAGNTVTTTTNLAGFQNYQVQVTEGTCSTVLDIPVTVADEILAEIVMNPNGQVCANNDIEFTVQMIGGGAFPAGWTFAWSWDGGSETGTGSTFTINEGVAGSYQVDVAVTNPGGCTADPAASEVFIVNPEPVVTITPDAPTICADGSVVITANVTAGEAPFDFLWGPNESDNITTQSITVDINSPETQALYVIVTDNNGCQAFSNFADVTIIPALAPVVFAACNESVDEVIFSWNDVGQDYFEVYVSIDGAPETFIDNYTDLTYTESGLPTDTPVTIRVVPVGGSGANICTGPENSQTCTTLGCPNPGWQYNDISPICVTTDGQPYDLFISTDSTGTITLNSTDLGLTNVPGGAMGMNTVNLPALGAGVNSAVYTVTASYLDANGNCPLDTMFNIPVIAPASAAFTLDQAMACASDQDVIITLTGGFDPAYQYTLSVDNTMGSFITDSDASDGTMGINFSMAGTYQITLTTQNIAEPGCIATVTESFTLTQPVAAPTLTCGDSGLDFLEIDWTDVGADSYVVNIVSIPAGATTSQAGTTFRVDGLNAGESVSITVTAVQAGCPDVTSAEISCIAQSCPPFTPTITTAVDTFCVDGSAGLIDLTVDVPATGTVMWSGPGVTGDQFDPAAAGVGFHIITVVYTEGTCTYPADIELGVVSAPNIGLVAVDGNEFCEGDVGRFAPTGSLDAGTTVEWLIPAGATIVSGGLTTFDTLSLTLGSAGAQSVRLAINTPFCGMDTLTADIVVNATPEPLTLDCADISFDQVGFEWSHPTASGFTVTVLDQPAGATIMENAGSLLATGLAEGESVTIRVVATIDGPCPDVEDTLTCTAQSCPMITVALDPVGPFCIDTDQTVPLNTVVMGSDGSGTLSYLPGPGVVGTDFVSTGLAAGTYEVIASFEEAFCTFNDTIEVVINPRPVASFAFDGGPICIDSIVGADAGAMQAGWSYVWFVPSTDATVINNTTTNISISWATSGTQTVGLVVIDDNGCDSDTLFQTIEVVDPLPVPVIGCGIASLTSVEFGWTAIPGATGYLVTVDNGTPFTQDSTNLIVEGLNQGDFVDIEVIALGNGPCGDSEPGTQTCEAGSCPTITVMAMDDQDFCTGAPGNVVTLTATQMGGSGSGVFTFSGPGVTDNAGVFTFDADAAGPGAHQINVLYDENTCTGVDSLIMTVTQTPGSNFALNGVEGPLNVCEGEDFTVAYTGPLTAADGATFTWEFAGATEAPLLAFENYTLSFATAGVYTLELTVTLNNCPSATTLYEVTVDAPLTPPVITCTASDLNSVTFSWDAVTGATGYELGDGTILPDTQTSFTVTGLVPGQDTTIMVTALSADVCGNSVTVTSESCSADDCPVLALDASGLTDEICLENGNETIDLSTVLVTGGTGNGTYVFSGPGVSGATFDAAAAGGSEAGVVHTIMVDYVEEGPCDFSGSFDITVFDRPSVFITNVDPACIDDAVQIIVGSTNFVANDDITIDFDGGTVIPDGDPDDSVYLVSWSTPGTKMVTASVVSNISGCESLPLTREVIIEAPLETPNVSCPTTAELEEITFSWDPVTGATGYEVTVNPGGTSTVDAATTTFLVDGLSPETPVAISVVALGTGPCGNSEPGLGACETAPCPGGTVQAITQDADFCLDGNQQAFLLEAELDMGTPSGPFVWSGTGVVDNGDGTFNFDPTGLGAGAYVLTVNYLGEADCTSSDEITIQLFDQPVSTIAAVNNVICASTETLVGLTGTVDPMALYVWDFDGAAQSSGPSAESYNLSWPVAGDYTVSLTVTANGCSTTSSVMITVDPPANSGAATGDDLALCAGANETVNLNTLLVGQTPGGTWMVSPNSPSSVGGVNVSSGVFNAGQLSAGDYIFAYEVTSGTCPAASTDVNLRLLAPPVADAGPAPRLTCSMGMATLDGTASENGVGYTYRWFATDPSIIISGGDQQTLDVSQPGTYFLEVTNEIGCSAIAEVEVTAETEAPVMEVDLSNISCFSADDGAILVTNVSGGRAPYTFTLNGEERGQSTLFAGLMAQEYNLQVTDANGCFSNLILDLTEPEELTVRLNFPGDSTEVAVGDEVTITATVNGGNPLDTLIWMPDSINTGESANAITFTATETQMISITVVDELGCRATDREMLLVRKDRRVYFPNAFSPNGDNINDIWFIGGDLDEIEFIDNFFIFDRWGEAVHTGAQLDNSGMQIGGDGTQFLPNDPAFGWDGTHNGRTMNPQVLVYTATVHFRDGEVIVYKGDFVLMK